MITGPCSATKHNRLSLFCIVEISKSSLMIQSQEEDFEVIKEQETFPSCIRGYHAYSNIWTPSIGERLVCVREPENLYDRCAVAVLKDVNIIGHLPRKISYGCSRFMKKGGLISCIISGKIRVSADLPQGGLEVPCHLLFNSEATEIARLKNYLLNK